MSTDLFASSRRRGPTIEPYRELYPALEFKLDVEEDWDRELMERLAATDRVRVLDLKAYYRNTASISRPIPTSTAWWSSPFRTS